MTVGSTACPYSNPARRYEGPSPSADSSPETLRPETFAGRASRTIGIHPATTWLDDKSDRVLEVVKRKGGKYGDLALPFIVAVGQAASFPEDEDTEFALYGTSVEYARASTPTFGRMPNGYWTATTWQLRLRSRCLTAKFACCSNGGSRSGELVTGRA